MSPLSPSRATRDLMPLAERIHAVHLLRGAMVIVASAVAMVPSIGSVDVLRVLAVGAVYTIVSIALESLRLARDRGLNVLGLGLLVDGLYLTASTTDTGGFHSPLIPLILVHVLAVTLVTGQQTGLRICAWITLLQCGDYAVNGSGLRSEEHRLRDLVELVVTIWVVTVAGATFSAINERELRRRTGELEAIRSLSLSLDDATTSDEVAQSLAEVAARTLGARRVAVIGTRDGWTRALAVIGEGADPQRPIPSPTLGATDLVLAEAWSSRQPALLPRLVAADAPLLDHVLPGGRNIAVLPMSAEGTPIGALVLELGDGVDARTERHVMSVAEQFASHAGLALSSAWLLEEVGRLAVTDSLTGLANRRALEREAGRFTARAVRRGEPLSLVLLDVDHFKALNDTFGHQAGDDVLREVALTLQRAARSEDIVSRYGGEEFAVLMPDCDEDEAATVAERLRLAVSDGGSDPAVTISGGVATYVPSKGGATLDLHDLLRGADLALYVSKRGGRNRISLARDLSPELLETLPHPARGRRVRAT
jgi:two-component system cell cycle response regulator